MYSREESKKIRQEFWTGFGKDYPHKWLLYNTRMKEIQLKFSFDRKSAVVSLDIWDEDDLVREYYYEKLESLKTVLRNDYIPEIIFVKDHELPEGKVISRIFVELPDVNIHNKKDWPHVKEFFFSKMLPLEDFFKDFSDYIKN